VTTQIVERHFLQNIIDDDETRNARDPVEVVPATLGNEALKRLVREDGQVGQRKREIKAMVEMLREGLAALEDYR